MSRSTTSYRAGTLTCGLTATIGLLAAERHRSRTGEGQEVRLSLADVAYHITGSLGYIGDVEINGSRAAAHRQRHVRHLRRRLRDPGRPPGHAGGGDAPPRQGAGPGGRARGDIRSHRGGARCQPVPTRPTVGRCREQLRAALEPWFAFAEPGGGGGPALPKPACSGDRSAATMPDGVGRPLLLDRQSAIPADRSAGDRTCAHRQARRWTSPPPRAVRSSRGPSSASTPTRFWLRC